MTVQNCQIFISLTTDHSVPLSYTYSRCNSNACRIITKWFCPSVTKRKGSCFFEIILVFFHVESLYKNKYGNLSKNTTTRPISLHSQAALFNMLSPTWGSVAQPEKIKPLSGQARKCDVSLPIQMRCQISHCPSHFFRGISSWRQRLLSSAEYKAIDVAPFTEHSVHKNCR